MGGAGKPPPDAGRTEDRSKPWMLAAPARLKVSGCQRSALDDGRRLSGGADRGLAVRLENMRHRDVVGDASGELGFGFEDIPGDGGVLACLGVALAERHGPLSGIDRRLLQPFLLRPVRRQERNHGTDNNDCSQQRHLS
jgi:hypothetical protein